MSDHLTLFPFIVVFLIVLGLCLWREHHDGGPA